jgi:hypothetical protein
MHGDPSVARRDDRPDEHGGGSGGQRHEPTEAGFHHGATAWAGASGVVLAIAASIA